MSGDIDPFRLDPDPLAAHRLVAQLELLERLPSTNDLALRLAADPDVRTPTLVVAQQQTAGRGRGANRWWSAPGALTFSLLVERARFGLSEGRAGPLSLAVAVAVCDALEPLAAQATWQIRWPNDVLVDGRKIGGILIELPNPGSAAPPRAVIGVGLNINNSLRDAPQEVQRIGTSLGEVTGQRYRLSDVLTSLLTALQRRLEQLGESDADLATAWQSRCGLRGRSIEVKTSGGLIVGECLGVDPNGALQVDTGDQVERLTSGVVT